MGGGPNDHPNSVEALQRFKILLLGSTSNLQIKSAPVEFESDEREKEQQTLLSAALTQSFLDGQNDSVFDSRTSVTE